jgi:hypothetical protein
MPEGIPVEPSVPLRPEHVVPPEPPHAFVAGYQIMKLEPVVSHVVGGPTSAVVLRGSRMPLPEGAVPVIPESPPA